MVCLVLLLMLGQLPPSQQDRKMHFSPKWEAKGWKCRQGGGRTEEVKVGFLQGQGGKGVPWAPALCSGFSLLLRVPAWLSSAACALLSSALTLSLPTASPLPSCSSFK